MPPCVSRRSFLALSATLPWAIARPLDAAAIPVGIELYSVRDELKREPDGTLGALRCMGYECVEFYAPYLEWTEEQAKHTRRLLDALGMRCYSTHNDSSYFGADKMQQAADWNAILGSKYVVMASSNPKPGADGWKEVAETLNSAAEKLARSGLKTGYHNHQAEFTPLPGGMRPIEIIAKNTKPEVMLQLDVGTCLEAGSDPVAWIQVNPGRIRSMHCKDWSPEPGKGYRVLFGEGAARWKEIFEAAEGGGGLEYYLIEQEGSRFPELETARLCLDAFRAAHGRT
ncbi:MAG TPA: sugar phosphate isomerase/epimerase family protein [Candidatus Acidoferrum sp.]|nr:sugar phosphate isomerase/epimerase family protein [Candidatus Acidoferrum sp.]